LLKKVQQFGRPYEKNLKSGKFSFRAELRAEKGFLLTHRGDQALFKKFFVFFLREKFVVWVIEVGEAESRKIFEIGQAVLEIPRSGGRGGKIFFFNFHI